MYENDIARENLKLQLLDVAIRELLEVSKNGKNKKDISKIYDIFMGYRKNGDSKTYQRMMKIINKLEKSVNRVDEIELRTKLTNKKLGSDYDVADNIFEYMKNEIGKKATEDHVKISLLNLIEEYRDTLKFIEMFNEKAKIENNNVDVQQNLMEKVVPTETDKNNPYEELVEESAIVLLNGPKRKGIIDRFNNKDVMLDDIGYLYGLAVDILILMENAQRVMIKDVNLNVADISNVSFPFYREFDQISDAIFKKYGVSNVEGLLNKYDIISKKYYDKFISLPFDKREKYKISNISDFSIKSVFGNGRIDSSLYTALNNERLDFPPSKQQLISMINARILNCTNFRTIAPSDNIDKIYPLSIDQYNNALDFYINLTKNMSVEEISDFYSKSIVHLNDVYKTNDRDPKFVEKYPGYRALNQRVFCEVIFRKKGLKYLDNKQFEVELEKIANAHLKEKYNGSTYGSDKIEEHEQKYREQTIMAEYIKYRVEMNLSKKNYVNFSDFVKQKYGLNNIVAPSNIEDIIDKEIKEGKKR